MIEIHIIYASNLYNKGGGHYTTGVVKKNPHTSKISCLLPMKEIPILYMSNLYNIKPGVIMPQAW